MPTPPCKRHVHLDPVGGIAGDMFVASMLDLFPQSMDTCLHDLELSGVLEHVVVSSEPGKSHGLAVQRFIVEHRCDTPRATGQYSDLHSFLQGSRLEEPVRSCALEILRLLAVAESNVHGVALEKVHFHEVADWDSIADIVAAASVIQQNAIDSWSCGCLPVGSGLVNTEHGLLPVPAPATSVLLHGLATFDDGEAGERVTPTGAAIVKYLSNRTNCEAAFAIRPRGIGMATGMGAGQRSLEHRPNIVRCTLINKSKAVAENPGAYDAAKLLQTDLFEHETDHVAQLSFAIDDMTSEELAVGLQHLRQSDGVFDVSHQMSFGKKGRLMFDVTVLCNPSLEPQISRRCFSETSTLGMRVQFVPRRILKREQFKIEDTAGTAGIKRVKRPLAEDDCIQSTLKVENDDLRKIAGLYSRRERSLQLSREAFSQESLDSSSKKVK